MIAEAVKSEAACGAGRMRTKEFGVMLVQETLDFLVCDQLSEVAGGDHQMEDVIAIGVLDLLEILMKRRHLALHSRHLLPRNPRYFLQPVRLG